MSFLQEQPRHTGIVKNHFNPIGVNAPGRSRFRNALGNGLKGAYDRIPGVGIVGSAKFSHGGRYDDGGRVLNSDLSDSDRNLVADTPITQWSADVNAQADPSAYIPTQSAAIPGSDQLSQPAQQPFQSNSYIPTVSTPPVNSGIVPQAITQQGNMPDDNPLLGSRDTDAQMASKGGGNWFNNKHWGIQGSTWLQAGLTALTGILSGISNKKASHSVPNIIGKGIGVSSPSSGFAQGGYVGLADGGMPADPSAMQQRATQGQQQGPGNNPQAQMVVANAIKALLGQSQDPQGDIQAFVQMFGQEALEALQQKIQQSAGQQQGQPQQGIAPQQPGMASGGLLQGPGGGMDDTIPANGGNIRLSGGEFIVPASDVANLGDGSSEAGARKLHQGIAKLRMHKYGRSKQPPKTGSKNII